MFKFFDSIVEVIALVINFVINAFKMLILLITQIPKALAYLTAVFGYLPAFLSTFIVIFIAIAVIVTLINKGDFGSTGIALVYLPSGICLCICRYSCRC